MDKKILNVLNGIAITGTAAAGVSVLGDSDLVYAQELEENQTLPESGVVEVQTSTENVSQPVSEAPAPAQEPVQQEVIVETVAETVTEQVAETPAPVEQQLDSFDLYSYETSASAEEAKAEAEEQIVQTEQQMASAEEEKQVIEQDIAEAEAQQASIQSQLQEAEAQQLAAEQAKADYEQDYREAGYENEGLDEQEVAVNQKIEDETAVLEDLKATGQNLTLSNFYEDEGRALAKEMILYKLILTGEVSAEDADKVFFGDNFNRNYNDKHYCVKYVKIIDGTPTYIERYFDYVTCDEYGNSMFQGLVPNENDSSVVFGINVVEKTPTYKVWTVNEHQVSTYDHNESGKIKDQKVFGYTFHAAQRDDAKGFYAEEGQQKKGKDWYTQKQYQQDFQNREEHEEKLNVFDATISAITAQVESLTATLDSITNNLVDLRGDLEDIEVKIEGYQNTIDNLKDKVDALTGRIQDLLASERAQAARAVESTSSPAPVQTTRYVAADIDNVVTSPAAGVQTQTDFDEEPVVATISQAASFQAIEEVQVPLAVMNVDAEEEAAELVIIKDQEVAKAAEAARTMAKWSGETLPIIGTMAAFFGFTKLKKEEKNK